MGKMKWFDWILVVLLLAGGLNWGSIAFFGYDFVAQLFGMAAMFVKGLVGVASVGSIVRLIVIAND